MTRAGSRLDLALLTYDYGPRMLEINRGCPIVADLTFYFERGPDFFAWPDAVFDRGYIYAGGFRGSELVAYELFGEVRGQLPWGEAFSYSGDVRVLPEARGAGFLAETSSTAAEVTPPSGVSVAVVKRGNRAAARALAATTLPAGVEMTWLCPFRAVNLLLVRPVAPPRRFEVRRARPEDLPALAGLMARAYRGRPFAPIVDEEELRLDIQRLPGFTVDRYYLALRGGEPVGALGAWDAGPVRRIAVVGYSRRAYLARLAYQLARRLHGLAPPLPEPGSCFRSITATRVAVPDGDPEILRDLLAAACRDHAGAGYHLLHIGFAGRDALAPAARGFLRQSFRSDLLVVTTPEKARALRSGPVPYLDLRLV